jgi:hypothetical protein
VLATVLLALLLRGVATTRLGCISPDGVQFVTYAKQLAERPIETMKTTTKQPGFPWLLLGAYRVFGHSLAQDAPVAWQRTGQIFAVLGGVLVCLLVFVLARELFDQQTALVAGILAAVWPQGVHLSADVLSDMPHLAFYMVALLAAYRSLESGRVAGMAVCGLLAGLAYMSRQEALGLVLAAGICWLWRSEALTSRERLIGVAALALCFAAAVAPHSIATGRLLPNKNPWDMLFGQPQGPAAVLPPSTLLAEVIPLWGLPIRMAEAWGKSGRYVISTLFLLALVLRSTPRAPAVGRRLFIAAVLLQLLAVALRVRRHGEISSRYMIIPLVLCLPWAAAGLSTFLNLLSARLRSGAYLRAIDVRSLGIVVAALPMLYYAAAPVNADRAGYRRAGEWLREHAGPNDLVLAHERLGQIMYYAGRTYPSEAWMQCGADASPAVVEGQIAERHPLWYVDAEGSHHRRIDEDAHFRDLAAGAIAGLKEAFAAGPAGRRAFVFRVGPANAGEAAVGPSAAVTGRPR